MTAAKLKVSVTLDADLVAELGEADETLSRQVNDAVRDTLERRRRLRLLAELCAELEARHGPVSKKLLAKYESLLT
ncbi:MAG: type II toxin-antitoxin system CcdA family antitoxin [Polyangiaceae bacterium]|nr:type II toxin-antitoxin system CcdA family antitoxin [Polyangiaceae bacterium]